MQETESMSLTDHAWLAAVSSTGSETVKPIIGSFLYNLSATVSNLSSDWLHPRRWPRRTWLCIVILSLLNMTSSTPWSQRGLQHHSSTVSMTKHVSSFFSRGMIELVGFQWHMILTLDLTRELLTTWKLFVMILMQFYTVMHVSLSR